MHVDPDGKKVVTIDLDGTLCKEEDQWPYNYIKAPAIPEAIELVQEIYAAGHKIVIHTARPYGDYPITKKWLEVNKIPYHLIVMGKCRADLYIDNDSCKLTRKELEDAGLI